MAATFKISICYPVDLDISNEVHRLLEQGDPAAARAKMMTLIDALGRSAHEDALRSAAITVLCSLKNGPQRVIFETDSAKVIVRG